MELLRRFEVPETRHLKWATDIWLPVALWLGCSVPVLPGMTPFLTSTMLIAPLLLRRRYPLVMLALMTVAGLLMVALVEYPLPAIAAVPIAVYSVARWVPGLPARASVIVGGIASVLGPQRWVAQGTSPTQFALVMTVFVSLCVGLVISPYVLGRRVRESTQAKQAQLASAAERYHRVAAERDQAARMAEARARNEIARELHDIVAHSLSVMIVQAEGGKALATKRPEQAAAVLETIADTGREALSEMRRIVGVLRADARPVAEYTPTPGLADLPEMIQRAGDRVSYNPPARLPTVPTTLGLTVYRVVQESVTNFLKHAGPEAKAVVTVQSSGRFLRVSVADDGQGRAAPSDGAGSGLKGMKERVTTMGGHLAAGPRPGGGFEVTALLPIPTIGQTRPVPPRAGVRPH